MIVNIYSSSESLITQPIHFSSNLNYNVKLIRLTGRSSTLIDPGLYFISTDLIQRSEGNPHRIIDCFLVTEPTEFLDFQPTHFSEYKLNRYDINSPDIQIRSKRTDAELFFEELFISFEVRETYGRF